MTLPRSAQISTEFTPYYHCVSRCVRRAFLCGRDRDTGYDFSHRKDWLELRIQTLAGIFALDVCAYSVMSNHYHVVLHINTENQFRWGEDEIVDRWRRLYSVPDWFHTADAKKRQEVTAVWRERLGSISWFMKCINEPLARLANKEDACKGRFWEGRFRSQALLDDSSLLKCMAYVDLNPVRANEAATLEESAHTAVRARIEGRDQKLAPMADSHTNEIDRAFYLPIRQHDYLTLVTWTGRQIHPTKRGRLRAKIPLIVDRLSSASRRSWVSEMTHLTRHYVRAIGTHTSLTVFRSQLGQERLKGLAG